nr:MULTISPECIES: DDE-type integrase/transposase/recombinase [unclassified Sphingobium]
MGEILESYVTKTRDKAAALTFMKKALNREGAPEAITAQRLRSYCAAMRELDIWAKQEVGRGEQPSRERSPLLSTTRGGAAAVQTNQRATGVRIRSRQRPQPLVTGTPHHRPTDSQGETLGGTGPVAVSHELIPCPP